MLDKITMLLQSYSGLFVKGAGITLMIAAVTVLFGTILGAFICTLRLITFNPLQKKIGLPIIALLALLALWAIMPGNYLAIAVVMLILVLVLLYMQQKQLNPIHALAAVYVEIIRGTPMLLQITLMAFVIPDIIGLDLSKLTCVIIALCMNSAAYVSELIRAGIQAVDKGQSEAARSLGLSSGMTMREIVLPQAIKNILPALCNEFIMIIKDSSLGSVFFIGELMTVNNIIKGALYMTIEPLIIVAAIYFVMTFTLSKAVGVLERRMAKGD